jgi:hypothetical protein
MGSHCKHTGNKMLVVGVDSQSMAVLFYWGRHTTNSYKGDVPDGQKQQPKHATYHHAQA